MGLFRMIDRWRMRRKFEKYVSPGVLKLIMDDPAKHVLPVPENKHFQFIIVSFDETNPYDICPLMDKLADEFFAHHAMIDCMTSCLLVGWLGPPFPEHDSEEERRALVDSLLALGGNSVRIAHGHCTSLFGNLGATKRFHYGGLIPDFSGILRKLLDSPFGTAIEVQPSPENSS